MEFKAWSKSLIFSVMSVAFVLVFLCGWYLLNKKTESAVFVQAQNQLITQQHSVDVDDCDEDCCCHHNHEHCDECECQECCECEECHNQDVNLLTLTSNVYVNAVLSLSPSKTYCTDGKNFYSFERSTQHYKCTNPEHSGKS